MVDEATQREAIRAAAEAVADRLEDEKEHLTDLDSAIGDADHGSNLARGFRAAADAVADDDESTPQELVKTIGVTLISEVGGASGPLYGGSIMSASATLDEGMTAESAVAFAEAYLEKVKDRGDAHLGAKTMVDALTPAVHTFKKSIEVDELPPLTAFAKATAAAERGVEYTVPLRAQKGRASFLGWRSVGHQDPGATSTWFIMQELLDVADDYLDGETDVDAQSPTIPDETPEEDA
jgi:dihydroxyacetone kinase-like protein